jgi:hypothetical protein
MTGVTALLSACCGLLLISITQIGHFVAFHQALNYRAELLAVNEAAGIHTGITPCRGLDPDVVACSVIGNAVSLEIEGEFELFRRRFTLTSRAIVANQWVEFTAADLP